MSSRNAFGLPGTGVGCACAVGRGMALGMAVAVDTGGDVGAIVDVEAGETAAGPHPLARSSPSERTSQILRNARERHVILGCLLNYTAIKSTADDS